MRKMFSQKQIEELAKKSVNEGIESGEIILSDKNPISLTGTLTSGTQLNISSILPKLKDKTLYILTFETDNVGIYSLFVFSSEFWNSVALQDDSTVGGVYFDSEDSCLRFSIVSLGEEDEEFVLTFIPLI